MSDTTAKFEEAAETSQYQDLEVFWYKEPVGKMRVTPEGITWKGFISPNMEKLFGETLPSRAEDGMPQCIANIVPDNQVFEELGLDNAASYLLSGLRYASNTVIIPETEDENLLYMENDYLQVDFDDFIDGQGVFMGHYLGKPPKSLEEDALAKEVAKFWNNRHFPRYSGQEIKLPVTLHEEGEIQKSIKNTFTHFLKFPNEGLKEGWGVNEWMCMQLAEATGLPTAKHALIQVSETMPPAYLVERFDINHESRKGVTRRIIQDFCTLAGMRPLNNLHADARKEGKAAGSIEKIAKTLREFSTEPDKDVEELFKRSLVSLAVGDSDMHRKNISMLFRYCEQTGEILDARMSPAYDITSEIHMDDKDIAMVLPMGNKPSNFKHKTLMACAKNMGIAEDRANEIMEETFTKIAKRAVEIANNPPDIVKENDMCLYTTHRIATIAVNRAKSFGYETPEWQAIDPVKVPTVKHGATPPPLDMALFQVAQI